jgi:uncharacterized iron-regulated membrane protein
LGILLLFFIVISSGTGLLLAWKKDVALLQPPTQKGSSEELSTWKSLDELTTIAQKALSDKYPEEANNSVEELSVRPKKGIVKVIFKNGNWEVQVDGTDGSVKSIAKRHSDWIEQLHDGSIISDAFKLISMNILGVGLLVLGTTGFWLWYAPKIVRKMKKN